MTKYGDGDTLTWYDPATNEYPAPTSGILDAPCISLRANVNWVGFLVGAVSRLAWFDVWDGDDAEKLRAVTEIDKFLDSLGGNNSMRLRQSTTNDCQLEQSWDCGQTWSLAFDYSLCKGATYVAITTIYNLMAEIELNGQINIYNDNPGAYAPDVEDDDDGTNAAYCYALRIFIEAALVATIERKVNENRRDQIVMVVGDAIAVIAAFWTGGLITGTATAIGAAIHLLADAFMDALDLAKLEYLLADDTQLNQLVCCAYADMADFRLTTTIWNDLWGETSCSTLGPEAQEFLPVLALFCQDFNSYVMFLQSAQQGWEHYEAGLLANNCLEDCPAIWTKGWLDGDGFSDWTLLPATSGALATYNAGEDRIDSGCNGAGTYENVNCELDVPIGTTVQTAQIDYTIRNTRATWSASIKWDDVNQATDAGDSPGGSSEVISISGKTLEDGKLRFYINAPSLVCADASYVHIHKITLTGVDTPL